MAVGNEKRSIFSLDSNKDIIIDASLKVTKIFNYFVASEYSQSNVFRGEISSLKYLYKDYGSDPYVLKGEVESVLIKLYSRYFTTVEVLVSVEEVSTNGSYNLNIFIECIDADGTVGRLEESNVLEYIR